MSNRLSNNSGNREARIRAERIITTLRLPIQHYIRTEEFGAILLLLAAITALGWVNSPWSEAYHTLWETVLTVDIGRVFFVQQDVRHWINDGLMTGFFFLKNTQGPGGADLVFSFGPGGAFVPMVGDWDGDGVETIGIYDPASGAFFLRNANAAGPADAAFTYGPAGAVPVRGDWNGA